MKEIENDPVKAQQYAQATRGIKSNMRTAHFRNKGELLNEEMREIIRLTISQWADAEWFTPKQLNRELGYDPEACINWIQSCLDAGPTEYKLNVL